jgi:hypothetical protein
MRGQIKLCNNIIRREIHLYNNFGNMVRYYTLKSEKKHTISSVRRIMEFQEYNIG